MKSGLFVGFILMATGAKAGGHFGDDPYDYIPILIGKYECSVSVGGANDQWASLTELVQDSIVDDKYSYHSFFNLVSERGVMCPSEVNEILYGNEASDRTIVLGCYPENSSVSEIETAMLQNCRGAISNLQCDESQIFSAIGDPISCRLEDFTDVIQNLSQRNKIFQ